ncbi:hypothetical protein [Mycobacterium sp. 1164966.3]|uniref:hypothetical protein n=1 Tax=Mycobacterium sp. 1164966.3 TaxID=1856861 RepID=UPI0012E88A67|nr:hypothetical protein [Mycobacterium sp. 1164966.3]
MAEKLGALALVLALNAVAIAAALYPHETVIFLVHVAVVQILELGVWLAIPRKKPSSSSDDH